MLCDWFAVSAEEQESNHFLGNKRRQERAVKLKYGGGEVGRNPYATSVFGVGSATWSNSQRNWKEWEPIQLKIGNWRHENDANLSFRRRVDFLSRYDLLD
jgi:hypothetical protein